MPAAVVAHNLGPHHAQTGIGPLSNSVREGVPEGGPPAPRVELVVGLVERRFASRARVDTSVGIVLVELAGAWRFSAFLTKNAELLCARVSFMPCPGAHVTWEDKPYQAKAAPATRPRASRRHSWCCRPFCWRIQRVRPGKGCLASNAGSLLAEGCCRRCDRECRQGLCGGRRLLYC
jgi:hypothetical protein